jgi:hypothetical protein
MPVSVLWSVPVPYDIFISYSHAADGRLGPALRTALQRFAKPWYRRRALNVFVDQASLAASSDLPSALRRALNQARFFIYLGSPEATKSRWVGEELKTWRSLHGSSNLLIAVTGGEVLWNEARQDFDYDTSTALHPQMAGMFQREPLWVDMRWARGESTLSARDPRFQQVTAMLAAPVHAKDLDELIGDDVKQHARTKKVVWTAITGFSVLLMLLAGITFAATTTAFTLQRRLQLISTLLPFFDDPQSDGTSSEPTLAGAIRILTSASGNDVTIDWNLQNEFVAAEEDCVFTGNQAGERPPDGCPANASAFGADGLRTDIPHLHAVATQLVDDINQRRHTALASALYDQEATEAGADEASEIAVQAETFASILLSSPLWEKVRFDGKEERTSGWHPELRSMSMYTYQLGPVGGDTALIFLRFQDSGYCGSGGCTVPTLAYQKRGSTLRLVWIGEVNGPMMLFEQGDGAMPRLFTLSLGQSGAFDQFRRANRFEFDSDSGAYVRRLEATVRATGGLN